MTQSDFLMNIIDKKNLINENTINFKENDYNNMVHILEVICGSIEVIPEIVFERIEVLDDEFELNKMIRNIPIENSRVIKLRIHFKIVDEDGNVRINEKDKKELRPTIDLLIPRLIDGTFILYDVHRYPMLQILDFKSLVKEKSTTIKTLINKMRLEIKKTRKKQSKVELELFKRKDMPLWLVLFSLYKPIEALNRVFKYGVELIDKDACEALETDIEIDNYLIRINNLNDITNSVSVENIMYESLKEFFIDKNVLPLLIKILKQDGVENLFNSSDTFIKILGSYYATNTNKYLTKGLNVVHSLNRFLDDISKSYMEVEDMLDMFLKEIEKIISFNESEELDKEIEKNLPNYLFNKRVRLSEYILFPFTKKLSENMHVILNSNIKDNNKINKILDIFKIDQNIILSYIMTNNLVRYNDQSNLMIAICKLKASFLTSESSKNISDDLRNVPRSGINVIDLITTPTGSSVGLTFSISAVNKNLFDSKGIIQKPDFLIES